MYDRAKLSEVLKTIDEEAELVLGVPARPYRVVIVGGSAFMLNGLTRRQTTHDIDVLEAALKLKPILARYRMVNSAVSAYLDTLPYNFEDRLVKLPVKGKVVEFLSPSLEDLAVMKLYAWRPNDQADLTSPEVIASMDWDLLDKLVNDPDEAAASVLSERRYQEMLVAYREYRRWCHGEADL